MNFYSITCALDFHFDNTIRCFLTNCHTDWQANQVTIRELHAHTLITVVS